MGAYISDELDALMKESTRKFEDDKGGLIRAFQEKYSPKMELVCKALEENNAQYTYSDHSGIGHDPTTGRPESDPIKRTVASGKYLRDEYNKLDGLDAYHFRVELMPSPPHQGIGEFMETLRRVCLKKELGPEADKTLKEIGDNFQNDYTALCGQLHDRVRERFWERETESHKVDEERNGDMRSWAVRQVEWQVTGNDPGPPKPRQK